MPQHIALERAVARCVAAARWLAIGGGILILAAAIVVTLSTTTRWLFNDSIPGDIELVQMAMAVAAFCFLPYCQVQRGNIIVDTFTSALPTAAQRALDASWDLVYSAVAALMAWRLLCGAWDAVQSRTVSFQLRFPFGYLIFVCAILAGFLAFVAAVTATAAIRTRR